MRRVLANPDAEPAAQPTFNLIAPRSACPACKAPITALQNIPVVSWLALGRKCANCKAPISVRYPLVELFTGVASGLIAWRFGYGMLALAGLFFTWFLIALTIIDFDTQLPARRAHVSAAVDRPAAEHHAPRVGTRRRSGHSAPTASWAPS